MPSSAQRGSPRAHPQRPETSIRAALLQVEQGDRRAAVGQILLRIADLSSPEPSTRMLKTAPGPDPFQRYAVMLIRGRLISGDPAGLDVASFSAALSPRSR
jgi:hypothetical protein